MSADFNWWLVVVGLVAGVALTWLVMADSTRRDDEVHEAETRAEAAWIARNLDDPLVDAPVAERLLAAHRRYLGFPPPDALVDPAELRTLEREHAAAGSPEA
ncbi:MAG: hypothetical protein WCK58_01890 [Chloroflexota bacterium]